MTSYSITRALVAALFVTLLAIAQGCDSPVDPNDIPRGAYGGMNDFLLGGLMTSVTGKLTDNVQGVVAVGMIGDTVRSGGGPISGTIQARAIFGEEEKAVPVNSVTMNGLPLPFNTEFPPDHYRLNAPATGGLGFGAPVYWSVTSSGTPALDTITIPQSAGTITLSSGNSLSLQKLANGDSLVIEWTNTLVDERGALLLDWNPPPTDSGAFIEVKPLTIVLFDDAETSTLTNRIRLTGAQILSMNLPPRGELIIRLARGVYRTDKTYGDGRRLGTFAYSITPVAVTLTP